MDNTQTAPNQSSASLLSYTYLTPAARAKIVRGEPVPVTDLDMPFRMYRLFMRAGMMTLEDVLNASEEDLTYIPGFGRNCLRVVNRIRAESGCEPFNGESVSRGRRKAVRKEDQLKENYKDAWYTIIGRQNIYPLPERYAETISALSQQAPNKERAVFYMRCGLDTEKIKHTNKEVAEYLDITPEYAAELYKNALKWFRHPIRYKWVMRGTTTFLWNDRDNREEKWPELSCVQYCRKYKLAKTKRIIEKRRVQGKVPEGCEDAIQELYQFISSPVPINSVHSFHTRTLSVFQELCCKTTDDIYTLGDQDYLKVEYLTPTVLREKDEYCKKSAEEAQKELQTMANTPDDEYHIIPIDFLQMPRLTTIRLKRKGFDTMEDILLLSEKDLLAIPQIGKAMVCDAVTACKTFLDANPWADIPERVLLKETEG